MSEREDRWTAAYRRAARRFLRCRPLAVALAVALSAGCRADDEAASGPADHGVADSGFGGLSREQIEQEAAPMTLEEAQRLGIVDTTILIEAPMNPDSVIETPQGLIFPSDTASRP